MNGNLFFLAKVSDNKDPDGFNRIKVTFFNEEEVVSNWIPYMSPIGGVGTGVSCLPDVDDQVLVMNLDSNGGDFIALGSIWSDVSTPPESGENPDGDLNSDGKNTLTFVKSKSENLIVLDDTDSKEKLQIIQNKTNSRVEFLAEDKKISITTDEEIDITSKKDLNFNAENVNIEAEKELNISCENLQVKASKEINLEASKDMSIKGSGIALN